MTEEHSNEVEGRLTTLEANQKHHSDEIKTMQNRIWALLIGVGAWLVNLLSKKIGL